MCWTSMRNNTGTGNNDNLVLIIQHQTLFHLLALGSKQFTLEKTRKIFTTKLNLNCSTHCDNN